MSPSSSSENLPPQAESLRLRIYEAPDHRPTVVFLPGIHGDWTLVGGFRTALSGFARWVEMTYPRTTTWSLEDYASAVEDGLSTAGITRAWVLAESFGSQVAWPLCTLSRTFESQGLILAGGFGRYPMPAMARLVQSIASWVPLNWLRVPLRTYMWIARFRFRDSPSVITDLDEFVRRRTEADRQAAVHRLRLILHNDPASLARQIRIPVFYLTGLFDPVVPWPLIPAWLRAHCPRFQTWKLIAAADHNVLGSAPHRSAHIVRHWVDSHHKS